MRLQTNWYIAGAVVALLGSSLRADTIQLVNGDRIKGQLVSLDDKQIVVKSESFGELKIPRGKVDLISLGEKGIPDFSKPTVGPKASASVEESAEGTANISPLLNDPSVQQQLGPLVQQLLGPGGDEETQRRIDEAQRGMKELRKDFGEGPEGAALDAYMKFFEKIAPAARALGEPGSKPMPRQKRTPKVAPPHNSKSKDHGGSSTESGEPVEAKKPDQSANP